MAVADLSARTETPWRTCPVCHAIQGMEIRHREILIAALSNPTIRYDVLAAELATDPAFMLDIDRQALSRHARGVCSAKTKLR